MTGTWPVLGLQAAALATGAFGLLRFHARLAHRGPAAAAAACLAALGVVLFLLGDPAYGFSDFRIAYLPAARAVLADPATLADVMGNGVNGFVNLPVVAYLFAPLGLLRTRDAITLFTVAGLASIILAWWLLVRQAALGRTGRWLLALLFVADGPLQYSLKEGNTSHIALLALVAGLALTRAGRPAAAGVVLGLAAVIKLPLLLFGAYFVFRRDWRGAAGFATAGLVAVVASLAAFGWAANLRWLQVCVIEAGGNWYAAFNVQSLPSAIARLHVDPGRLVDWTAFAPDRSQRLTATIATLAIGLLALSAAAWGRRPIQDATRTERQYLLTLCLCLVLSPLSWTHYFCWLLVPAAFLVGGRLPMPRLGWTAILLATPMVKPVSFADPLPMAAWQFVLVSHVLAAGLFWCALLAWSLIQPRAVPAAIGTQGRLAT